MKARRQSRTLEAGKSWHQMARVVKNEDEWQYVLRRPVRGTQQGRVIHAPVGSLFRL